MILHLGTLLFALIGCTDSAADLLKTCDGGNSEACYHDGLRAAAISPAGTVPDHAKARKLFAKACMPTFSGKGRPKKNFPPACAALGHLVRDGKGGPRDLPRAAELFEIACKGGVANACVDLGVAVYDPPRDADVNPEPARAVELFFNVCNDVDPAQAPVAKPGGTKKKGELAPPNLARACDALGKAYEEGKGVENGRKDPDKALELYLKACDARVAGGCVHAGNLLAARKRTGDVAEAAVLLEAGCRLDARHGCFDLAVLHEKGAWPDASPQKAAEFYERICNIDPTQGCFESAQLKEKGLVDSREGEIESLYNLACEHGSAVACTRRNVQ